MLLEKLISHLSNKKKKIKVKGLATNSKKIKKGFIFFAIKGHKLNGEKYIIDAIKKGACLIICSSKCKFTHKKIPVFKTSNIRYFLSKVSAKFYKIKPKNIIAVTGTNGKTSVADLFYQILSINKVPVASIGTLGIKYNKRLIKSDLTTPDTISLHQSLERIKSKKIDNVIIEASSHGLHQQRLDHLNMNAGIFTNFSQDHLDYHKTMSSYLKAKMLLFNRVLSKKKKIISDESIKEYKKLVKISKDRKLYLTGIKKIKKKIENIRQLKDLSDLQKKNLSMAVAAAKLCNLKDIKIFDSLKKIKDVNGRLELVKIFPNNIKVYVDFAHTPDALLKVIKLLKRKHGENISLVFGCGGERDFKKRSIMGKIASLNCKKIYVTDDNPRNENPNKIRKDIIKSIKNRNCFNIGNRSNAIKTSIQRAEPNEIILVAGKGHETEQIYKSKIFSVSDKQLIKKINLKLKKNSKREINLLQNKTIIRDISGNKKIENFDGISIDSRTVKKNNLFVTVKGKNHNGIKFISDALKKGARYIVSSKSSKKYLNKIIKVEDEIKFLNNYASMKRGYTTAKIFAITGSAGKTSLKDLTKNLLQIFGETLSSPRSYNNQFGVPLSMSQLSTRHKYGVFEVGMSKAGEINKLTKLIRPHVGIITNIGEAHIENFKNLKGIADAKGEIINNIQDQGALILNRDDKYFHYLKEKALKKDLKIISFGMRKNSDVYPLKITKKNNKTIFAIQVKDQIFNLEAKNINTYNILSSLALLSHLKLDLNKATKYFKGYEPSEGRGKIHNIKRYRKNFKLVDESYNANPLSVKSAIKNFNSIKKHKFKKYLILGDMLELGRKSNFFHKKLSKVINNSDIDKVFIKGDKTIVTYKNIIKKKRGNIFQREEDVDLTLNNIIDNNDYLMIKGSNATGLNDLSKRIIKGF